MQPKKAVKTEAKKPVNEDRQAVKPAVEKESAKPAAKNLCRRRQQKPAVKIKLARTKTTQIARQKTSSRNQSAAEKTK